MDQLTNRLTKTNDQLKQYLRERASFDAAELICGIMNAQQVSRVELARRLGKTKGYISQLLDGESNLTIGTLSDVLFALGHSIQLSEGDLEVIHPPLSCIKWCESPFSWPTPKQHWPAQVGADDFVIQTT